MKKSLLKAICIFISFSIFAHGAGNGEDITEHKILFDKNEDFEEIEIEISDWDFSQKQVELKSSDKMRIIFFIKSGHHGVSIPELGMTTGNMSESEFVIWDLNGIRPGEYEFFCNIPCGEGHSLMKGKLIVTA